jgi:hypothetical protein
MESEHQRIEFILLLICECFFYVSFQSHLSAEFARVKRIIGCLAYNSRVIFTSECVCSQLSPSLGMGYAHPE